MDWANIDVYSYNVMHDSEEPVLYETGESRKRREVEQNTMTKAQSQEVRQIVFKTWIKSDVIQA